ncbi:hypothetical protein [Acinetobacter sp. ANC 4862]|uniref:hypothetical protein n=1 Tax=Acinetobacter sp. ANC 4862 TaxID=2529849 RepID=UPI001039CB81|nr:hypothetical protein [Acinetobacter sp. ANC 4862]TCH61791.1 hypothetical protein E0409_14170 [Acinetobacter sp. ANC 4862]
MIYEYALDPKVIIQWLENENLLNWLKSINGIGIGTPRFISTFPNQKKRKFIKGLAKLKDGISDQKVLERLDCFCEYLDKAGMLERLGESAQINANEWHERVIYEHNLNPFKAIVTQNKLAITDWLPPDNIFFSNLWNVPSQVSFNRTHDDFLKIISQFVVSSSKDLIIIDAYCWKDNAINVIKSLLNLFEHKKNPSYPSVKIYYKENRQDSSPSPEYIKNQLLLGLNNTAKALEITICQIKETDQSDAFHNRYILNELGGIQLGHGLDLSGKEHHTDEATLLVHDVYMKRLDQFYYPDKFEILDKVEFGGK